jgi:hypothetical protein
VPLTQHLGAFRNALRGVLDIDGALIILAFVATDYGAGDLAVDPEDEPEVFAIRRPQPIFMKLLVNMSRHFVFETVGGIRRRDHYHPESGRSPASRTNDPYAPLWNTHD